MNRLSLPTLTLTALLSVSALAQGGAEKLPPDLRAQYEAMLEATRQADAQAYGELLTEDAALILPDGSRLNRATLLATLVPGQATYQKLEYRVEGADIAGDTARVTARTITDMTLNVVGTQQPVHVDALSEDLWRKVGGQWKLAESRTLETTTEASGQVTRQVAAPPLSPAVLEQRREALRAELRPISATGMDAPASDFAWLSELTPGTRLLGLGEGSHGTAEHFALKGRIFRELVERHGFTVFLIEADYDDAYAIDRWVRGEGTQSAEDITREFDFWTWQTQEMADLLRWMREYNAARGDKPELRVAGVDMQDPLGSLGLLERLAPSGSRLSQLAGQLEAELARQMEQEKPDWARAKALAAWTDLHARSQPVGTSQQADLRHLGRTVYQGVSMVAGMSEGDFNQLNVVRDQAMAENTEWLLRELFPGQKAALWAHNFHVSKVPAEGQAYANLGSHLSRRLGPAYRVIGFSFGGGTLRAVPSRADGWIGERPEALAAAQAQPTSLDGLTASLLPAGTPAAFLNVAAASQNPALREWFAQPVSVSSVGAMYTENMPVAAPARLPAAFDGLILTPRSSAAVPLPDKRAGGQP
ncbi:erythromycin esterase family protein [Deinococcus lacus]|uniref:Erythromycin esterase family protein n=1 Tax=Deinococcus lacus TaxID=392561 RepID=A0ABW1YBA7_9DEIO